MTKEETRGECLKVAEQIYRGTATAPWAVLAAAQHYYDWVTGATQVDWTGRAYVKPGVEIELSYQDEGRTLKVFVKARE